jgi:hypothetical protein
MVKRLGEWVLANDGTSLPEKSLIGRLASTITPGMYELGSDHKAG